MIDQSKKLNPNHHQIQHLTEEVLQMRRLQEENNAPIPSSPNEIKVVGFHLGGNLKFQTMPSIRIHIVRNNQ
jgi:hypothetical protein